MPYHVVVTRQVLLDGPLTFFATLTLYLLARYASRSAPSWLYAAGAAMGLTVLAKETASSSSAPSSRSSRSRRRSGARAACSRSAGVMAITIMPFPLAIAFAGKSHTGGNFLAWQLFRRPNHSCSSTRRRVRGDRAPRRRGRRRALAAAPRSDSWRETLLLSWIVVPAVFFELWPVKGFQYLLPSRRPSRSSPRARSLAGQPQLRARRCAARPPARCLPSADGRRCALARDPGVGRGSQPSARPARSSPAPAACPAAASSARWIGRTCRRARRCSRSARRWRTSSSSTATARPTGCRSARTRCTATRPTSRSPTPTSRSARARSSTSSGTPTRPRARSSSPDKLLRYVDRYHGRVVYTRHGRGDDGRTARSVAPRHRRLRGAAVMRAPLALAARRSPRRCSPARPAARRAAARRRDADQALRRADAGEPHVRQLLRHLPAARDGTPADVCMPRRPRARPQAGCVEPFRARQPRRRATSATRPRSSRRQYNGGQMDGFVNAFSRASLRRRARRWATTTTATSPTTGTSPTTTSSSTASSLGRRRQRLEPHVLGQRDARATASATRPAGRLRRPADDLRPARGGGHLLEVLRPELRPADHLPHAGADGDRSVAARLGAAARLRPLPRRPEALLAHRRHEPVLRATAQRHAPGRRVHRPVGLERAPAREHPGGPALRPHDHHGADARAATGRAPPSCGRTTTGAAGTTT